MTPLTAVPCPCGLVVKALNCSSWQSPQEGTGVGSSRNAGAPRAIRRSRHPPMIIDVRIHLSVRGVRRLATALDCAGLPAPERQQAAALQGGSELPHSTTSLLGVHLID